jgi:hypothetical protein
VTTNKSSWEEVRELVEKHTGPVHSTESVSEGLSSEVSLIVHTDQESTFVKGRRADHPWVWTQRTERAINPTVRPVAPRLRWAVTNDAWDLNGFEYVPGRRADYSPGSADLPAVMSTLQVLQEIRAPDTGLKRAEQRWSDYSSRAQLFTGNTLLHTEWTPGNVLVSHRAYLVDWAWPTRGAAWIDPACLVVWLISSGHQAESAETQAAYIPSWHTAPPEALYEFALAQARMWAGIADDHPEPWTHSVAAAASRWATHRDHLKAEAEKNS